MKKISIPRTKDSWHTVTRLMFILMLGVLAIRCSDEDNDPKPPAYEDPPALSDLKAEVALKWCDMSLYTLRWSGFNTPTYSSRSLGYLGLAMYESIVAGSDSHQSVASHLTGGPTIPASDPSKKYHWILSLNAAQDTLLKLLYPVPANSHRFIHERIDSLANAIHDEFAAITEPQIVEDSEAFGKAVALAIYNWSVTDGGHEGFKRNFDSEYVFPTGDSYWVPPVRGQTVSFYPLHPHWGSNRRFVVDNEAIAVPDIIPYSTDPSSEYYQMYKAVYDKDKLLSRDDREIAAWWGDDPTETFSPPGHSYHIAAIASRSSNASLITAAEAFARVGLSVADGFATCWKVKYVYHSERPSSFITKYIDPAYVNFWPEPPFPAFPSGHSMHSAASAEVLTDIFGDSFSFVDEVHEGKRRFDDVRFLDLTYPKRSFSSFWEAADECAYSRFLGGIHTQQDNDVAQDLGKQVGANVNALPWRK
jgi:membrane-associated phospholipid phosphatase